MRTTPSHRAALILAAALVVVPVLAAASPSGAGTGRAAVARPGATGPCGTLSKSQVHYSHIIWIWMENKSYSTIIGSGTGAPYINSLASECGLATNYHNVSHPSLPNYVSATSGLSLAQLSPFKTDCIPSTACSTSAPSIFGQGETWKAYEESMPSNCDMSNSGEYAVRHDPPPYYTTLSGCSTDDVPYTQLATDLSAGSLPAFSFITPNLIDDMHDGTIADGDNWLSANLPTILDSSEYTSGTVAVFITWDEGEGGTSDNCARNTTDVGCHVPTIVVSPSTVPGTASSTLFNHYSLLRTAESLLRLPLLDLAAKNASMAAAFNL